jgi:hypothetical protein
MAMAPNSNNVDAAKAKALIAQAISFHKKMLDEEMKPLTAAEKASLTAEEAAEDKLELQNMQKLQGMMLEVWRSLGGGK